MKVLGPEQEVLHQSDLLPHWLPCTANSVLPPCFHSVPTTSNASWDLSSHLSPHVPTSYLPQKPSAWEKHGFWNQSSGLNKSFNFKRPHLYTHTWFSLNGENVYLPMSVLRMKSDKVCRVPSGCLTHSRFLKMFGEWMDFKPCNVQTSLHSTQKVPLSILWDPDRSTCMESTSTSGLFNADFQRGQLYFHSTGRSHRGGNLNTRDKQGKSIRSKNGEDVLNFLEFEGTSGRKLT